MVLIKFQNQSVIPEFTKLNFYKPSLRCQLKTVQKLLNIYYIFYLRYTTTTTTKKKLFF